MPSSGVKSTTIAAMARKGHEVASALWVVADRIVLTEKKKNLPLDALKASLARETTNINKVADRLEQIRVGLQKALLSGTASEFLEGDARRSLEGISQSLTADEMADEFTRGHIDMIDFEKRLP